ncbi:MULTISPECIES: hypothetical protein [Prochlorococcus]|uniref:N-acetyltransferase domain-containing protein n=1 Tax=Prochlorococcus marinus (strain SARG / CCMP1375 / SS120) TaxID=167539 RepID=Q7VBJ2_PROMA|nr:MULTISPECIES: hypothetical protein [Prochlorococcus]AAQ00145.1 Uncharacterized protein Pro_1100 [Prochlorococcus marinus subsp. marinus str. CCMP1375]KGG13941.1 hypothetical protein EV04_0426 [Prochlorococcus marinus str. LG]KGG19074.1 hypothetical protein EV08_1561 [Prochlorococcus marinus str. SS2]KGG23386.1 hypothetical protein EV09_1010 [Prochlorococcus marinus str. SS35]KGG32378.1 hypothetical protein EV10_1493 [Prochlorococcus marinus str. SS51]
MTKELLDLLEKQASSSGLLLRIQVRRPLNLWTLRLVVGRYLDSEKVKILGELKGWAYHNSSGLQLDTMQVSNDAPIGVGHLIWASTMAWALEETPCKKARLLAIYDDAQQNKILIRYFQRRGFRNVKEVGSSPVDLPFRMVWGGAGSLMVASCSEVYEYSLRRWEATRSIVVGN